MGRSFDRRAQLNAFVKMKLLVKGHLSESMRLCNDL